MIQFYNCCRCRHIAMQKHFRRPACDNYNFKKKSQLLLRLSLSLSLSFVNLQFCLKREEILKVFMHKKEILEKVAFYRFSRKTRLDIKTPIKNVHLVTLNQIKLWWLSYINYNNVSLFPFHIDDRAVLSASTLDSIFCLMGNGIMYK